MMDIPVFHDDQDGTAVILLAALISALEVVDKIWRNQAGDQWSGCCRNFFALAHPQLWRE